MKIVMLPSLKFDTTKGLAHIYEDETRAHSAKSRLIFKKNLAKPNL